MTHSFKYVSDILTNPTHYLFHEEPPPPPGELQFCGAHFLAVIHYALKKCSPRNKDATLRVGLTSLADSSLLDIPMETFSQNFLYLMASFLIGIKEFFTIQQLHQYSFDKKVDFVESFIEFLIEVLERLSSNTSCSWVMIPDEINLLCKGLKFLFVFLQDTPFQRTDLKESRNVLVEIESIANESGIFLHSSLFTTDDVTMTKIGLDLSLLLSKLEVVEQKIQEHCVSIFEQKRFTTLKLTSASIYIVDSFLDDLNHLLNHKVDLIVEVKDQITTLHKELYSSRSMLRDIELHENKEKIECEMQLIDLAYQAEYIIAYFVAGEVHVWYLALRLSNFIWKSESVRALLAKIKPISGIRGVQVAESSQEVSSSQVAPKSILMANEIIVGLEKKKKEIASQLLGGPNRLQIISIIGMGGIGKTTLVRKLYNDSNVLRHFDKRSWCVVSHSYEKRNLLVKILSSISSLNKNELSKMEDHHLAERVHKSLKGTRYLLVVDDIWKKEAWDDLKRYFPDDRNGSKIVFTSRNKDVALQASFEPIIHDLPLLYAHECWDLLQKKVFPNSICPQELQDVGKEIARNCKGLPLAVVGIAAVLSNMDNKKILWQKVATNLTSYISNDKDILELSYEHLPSHLKPCFLYLGVFEEDEEIPVKQLLSLWVSNGFIPKNEHKILEDVAEDYLLELINRSMVQVSKRRSDNGIKTFTMHDLIQDMCVRLADEENFVSRKYSAYLRHQHICTYSNPYDLTSRSILLHIRSISYLSDLSPNITPILKRLRVLKISNPEKNCDGTALEFLVQLRHLDSAGDVLNFRSHMNLEFLCIKTPERHIQLNMPKLRHLYLGGIVPLRKLDIRHAHSLETLAGITIENFEYDETLRCFSHLRCLYCQYTESWGERSPDLSSLTQLVSLYISIPFSIKWKTINWPIHIKKLSIRSAFLSCGLLSSVGTLPQLETLKLLHVIFEEKRWNTNDEEFQTLKFLKLKYVTLKEWNTSYDHFPVLEKLVLNFCEDLDLPSELGYIPTLQRIEVNHCAKGVRNSAKHIKEEQEEEGNELLHVIIDGTQWFE